MKVAIMQPYFFPYLGYFQLIEAVDIFVFYDDVNYIKGGWINRNRLVVNENPVLFSVPLLQSSQNKLINEIQIESEAFGFWKKKFLRTLEHSYKKAPFFEPIFFLVKKMLDDFKGSLISELAMESILLVFRYLGLNRQFLVSSKEFYESASLKREARLFHICHSLDSQEYINSIGGIDLYSKKNFQKEHIQLWFLKSKKVEYSSLGKTAIPGLSIIDVLMFNSVNEIDRMLDKYELL